MKIAFRIECPHCRWGHEWHDDYVNQGWLQMRCGHCGETFVARIDIPTVNIEINKELPEGACCFTLPEVKLHEGEDHEQQG